MKISLFSIGGGLHMLKGKTAIVTGGTRGIGFATVRKFLQNGASVALLGTRQETVDAALKKLSAENPGWRVIGFHPDLGNPKEVEETFAKIKEQFGSIDILVNNAGVSARGSIYDYKTEDFDYTVNLNLNCLFYAAQAAARIMKEQGGGVILNTSSMVSLYGQPSGVAYPASKSAVNGLTKSLARELGRDNIRVNAVAPGVTRTDMVAALPDALVAKISEPIPLGRIGEPEDIANAFLFLASDMASYITGVVLSVDGAAMT